MYQIPHPTNERVGHMSRSANHGHCFIYLITKNDYSVKRSDVTGNRSEWELGENKVI